MTDALFLYTTWPDAETAAEAARAAVAQGLAACANLFPPITSIYRWEGVIETSAETPMTLKTTRAAAASLRALIVARHPYETPCILALPVDTAGSDPKFLQWLQGSVAFT